MTDQTSAKTKKETVIETVTMQDGRVVDFPGKRKLLKTSITNDNGQLQVQLDFRNGQTRLFTLPQALIAQFALHGAEQKLGDEIAGVEDTDDCVLAIDDLIERLYNGEWAQKRESSGIAGTSVLVRALMEHTGKDLPTIKAFLANKSQAEKVALRNNPKVAPIVRRIEEEKAAKKSNVDTEALLAEIG